MAIRKNNLKYLGHKCWIKYSGHLPPTPRNPVLLSTGTIPEVPTNAMLMPYISW